MIRDNSTMELTEKCTFISHLQMQNETRLKAVCYKATIGNIAMNILTIFYENNKALQTLTLTMIWKKWMNDPV